MAIESSSNTRVAQGTDSKATEMENGHGTPEKSGLERLIKMIESHRHSTAHIDHLQRLLKRIRASIIVLPTGDALLGLRDDRQALIMPDGQGSLILCADGNFNLNAPRLQQINSHSGVTVMTFENGHTIAIDADGMVSISRDTRTAAFPRLTALPGEPVPTPVPSIVPGSHSRSLSPPAKIMTAEQLEPSPRRIVLPNLLPDFQIDGE